MKTWNAWRHEILVDAQLPRRFTNWLNEAGHDTLHTLDLPWKNLAPDGEVIARAMQDGRIVASKDADFVHSLLDYWRASAVIDLHRQH